MDVLRDRLVQEADRNKVDLDFQYPDNWGREVLNWVLFFGVMILIWVFVMRRIGGGGGRVY